MKTLVIHPADKTTDFLKPIYEGKGYTVVNERTPNDNNLREMMSSHDRIVMMGHGCPYGLFGGVSGLLVNKTHVDILSKKKCVFIWCNADQFVLQHSLKGFFTGMFISEVIEARLYRIDAKREQIDHSNNLFVEKIKDKLDCPDVLNEIKSSYVGDCPVIRFNNSRLYYF